MPAETVPPREPTAAAPSCDAQAGLAAPSGSHSRLVGGRDATALPLYAVTVAGRPPLSCVLGRHWTVREHQLLDWDHATRADVDYVLGACQLVRAEALVGVLDEAIFYGPEDEDLCLRLHEAGWRVLYEPAAVVVHRYRRMTVRAPLSRQGRALVRGYARLFVRHRKRSVPRRIP